MHREEERMRSILHAVEETCIVKQGMDIGAYKAYRFTDKENETAFLFRFKRSYGENPQPLVIYFCGAGSLGWDNLKPFNEFIPRSIQLSKYNCNILIPQLYTGIKYNNGIEEWHRKSNAFVASVKKLTERLAEDGSIDINRIYIFGNSMGGGITWRFAYNYPEFCACAMPVMGALFTSGDCDFRRFVKLPIWVAHSSNDTNVTIDRDDNAVARIKELGGNIKYTRWDKYGHGMAGRFYFKEKWADWMFAQYKNINK